MRRAFAILALLALCLSAGAKGWFYQNIKAPDGRSNDFVCTYVEPRGYAWGGMKHGLFRFGYNQEYRWYYADGKEGSIPGDYIYRICQDPAGNLWVATDKGAARYDRATDSFIPLMSDGGIVKAYCFFATTDGVTYIGGDNAIYVFDNETGKAVLNQELGFQEIFRIEDIYEAGDGKLFLYNREKGGIEYYPGNGKVVIPDRKLDGAYTHYSDSKGRFWISRFNRGVECYHRNGNLAATYTSENSGLSSNLVTCFLERDGEIFIGTDGGGINILNPDDGSFKYIGRDPEQYNSFPCASVVSLDLDASNSVWATGSDGGVVLLRYVYMRSFAVSPVYDQTGRSSDGITCFAQSATDKELIYAGTGNSGLYELRITDTGVGSNFTPEHIASTGTRKIKSLLALPGGDLMIAYYADGIYIMDHRTKKLKPFDLIKDEEFNKRIRFSPSGVDLSMDEVGHVMILADDAYVWDLATNTVVKHPIPTHENHDAIYPVSNGNGEYYFCESYIYHWDSASYRHDIIYSAEPGVFINSVTMDVSGTFWLATDSGVFSYRSGLEKAERLESEQIHSAEVIISDDSNRIWVGTSSAMLLLLPQYNSLMKFTDNDGANWNKYDGKTWLYTGEHLLFGGSNGILSVDPSLTFYLTDMPDIVLEEVKMDGKHLTGTDRTIRIPPYYKSFYASFLAKENNILRRKEFRIVLNGGKEKKEIINDTGILSFSDITPGKYTVSVSCTLQNGEWTDEREMLRFKVIPVWYHSWWFWTIMTIIVISVIFLISFAIRNDSKFKLALAESEAEAKAGQDGIKFLLNVSHELKTPLTLILSPLSRLLKTKEKGSPEYVTLSNIYRQANRMSNLILTVLDSHKIQDGSAKLNAGPVGINKWVEDIVETFDEEAESHGMVIKRAYDKRLGNIEIDGAKLENVLTNMMINAFKHSPDNTVITVGTKNVPESESVRISVSDQGEGLEGVDMNKLFSRFYQGYAQKTGSGLGLAYANSIVELHGGLMGAAQNQGKGATFYFDIPGGYSGAPADSDVREQVPKQKIARRRPAADISQATILIVDDDSDLRDYVSATLTQYCKNTLTAPNGRIALDILNRERPDVVVSDIMMPVMDGYELCTNIKRSPALLDIPVILLTAKVGDNNKEYGLSLGADAYLPKPFEEEDLIETINEILKG